MTYYVQIESLDAPEVQTPISWPTSQASFASSSNSAFAHSHKVVVLPPLGRSRHAFNWNLFVGMVTVVGVSAASWTGVALLVSRLLK